MRLVVLFVTIAALLVLDTWMCSAFLFLFGPDRSLSFSAAGLVIGVLAAQASLVATWFAFGTQSLTMRLTLSVVLFLALISTWFAGLALNNERVPVEFTLFTVGFCALLFASVAALMWFAQRQLQRSIRMISSSGRRAQREQYSIRFVMVVTALIALLLSGGRLIFANQTWSDQMKPVFSVMAPLTLLVLGFGVYITAIVLPLSGVILGEPRFRSRWLWFTVAAVLVLPFVLSEILFSVPGIGRPPDDIYWGVIGSPFAFGLSVILVDSGGLYIARRCGLRMLALEKGKIEGNVDAFRIALLPPDQLGPDRQRLGSITIGDFTERFVCHASDDDLEKMNTQWHASLQRLVDGAGCVALVHDPQFAWVIYREGEDCFIQQKFSPDGVFDEDASRATVSEDGKRISEWQTSLTDIKQFLTET